MLVVGGVASGLIFLFMVKGLFKRSRQDAGSRVEVTEAAQPELFAFIRKLCADTRAPFPHRVFLVPDVNAAVAYNESFLNLVSPARKNLIIGLGLVNRLTLTEFKAVLAHEFGHFSQKSMKLGRYVYTANKVVADVVYARDWLDDAVAAATRTDIRIAVFAWAVQGILWCLRKLLAGLFRATNFANASLSRQMEYNADLVAASVTGSDALVFALAPPGPRRRRARAGVGRPERRRRTTGTSPATCTSTRPARPSTSAPAAATRPSAPSRPCPTTRPRPCRCSRPRTPACRGCGPRTRRTTTAK